VWIQFSRLWSVSVSLIESRNNVCLLSEISRDPGLSWWAVKGWSFISSFIGRPNIFWKRPARIGVDLEGVDVVMAIPDHIYTTLRIYNTFFRWNIAPYCCFSRIEWTEWR
jgi:hypothetical protein